MRTGYYLTGNSRCANFLYEMILKYYDEIEPEIES